MKRKIPYQSTVGHLLLPYMDQPITASVLSVLSGVPLIGTQSALRGLRRNKVVRRKKATWKGRLTEPVWVRVKRA